MNDRARRALMGLGYSLWFSVLFLLLTLLTFPWSRVRDNVTLAAARSDIAVTMDSLGPAWVGARARGLSVGPLGGEEAAPPWIHLGRIKARTGLFSLLRTSRVLSAAGGSKPAALVRGAVQALGAAYLDADLYGGELRSSLGQAGDDASQLDLNLRDIDLAPFEIDSPSFKMNPRGLVRGKADVTWNWADVKKTSGVVDLTIDDLVVSGLKAGIMALPEMAFSRSEAHLKITRGKAELVDTAFEADEVQAEAEGTITLAKSLMRSRLSIKLKFKLRDDLDALTKVVFGSNPRHKDEDGWYHYQLNGTLARYRFREAAAAAGAARRGPTKRGPRRQPASNPGGDEQVSRRENRPSGDEPAVRKRLHEMDDPVEIEAERARLKEERAKRREERNKRREDLLARRRARQQRLRQQREDAAGANEGFDDLPIVRSNDPEGGVDEEPQDEGELIEEPQDGELQDGEELQGDGEFIEE